MDADYQYLTYSKGSMPAVGFERQRRSAMDSRMEIEYGEVIQHIVNSAGSNVDSDSSDSDCSFDSLFDEWAKSVVLTPEQLQELDQIAHFYPEEPLASKEAGFKAAPTFVPGWHGIAQKIESRFVQDSSAQSSESVWQSTEHCIHPQSAQKRTSVPEPSVQECGPEPDVLINDAKAAIAHSEITRLFSTEKSDLEILRGPLTLLKGSYILQLAQTRTVQQINKAVARAHMGMEVTSHFICARIWNAFDEIVASTGRAYKEVLDLYVARFPKSAVAGLVKGRREAPKVWTKARPKTSPEKPAQKPENAAMEEEVDVGAVTEGTKPNVLQFPTELTDEQILHGPLDRINQLRVLQIMRGRTTRKVHRLLLKIHGKSMFGLVTLQKRVRKALHEIADQTNRDCAEVRREYLDAYAASMRDPQPATPPPEPEKAQKARPNAPKSSEKPKPKHIRHIDLDVDEILKQDPELLRDDLLLQVAKSLTNWDIWRNVKELRGPGKLILSTIAERIEDALQTIADREGVHMFHVKAEFHLSSKVRRKGWRDWERL